MKKTSASTSGDHAIVRARWAILLIFAAMCAWLIPGLANIENDDDVLAFLPPDHPEVINFHEVAEQFGMMEVALIGLSDGGEDMLVPERVDKIRALSKKITEVKPITSEADGELLVLAGVNTTISVADLPHPIVTDDGLIVDALVPEKLRDPEKIRTRVLGSRDAVGNFISEDGKASAILVFLLPRGSDAPEAFTARREVLAAIRATVDEGWDGEAYFTGAPYIEMAASDSSRKDIETLSLYVIAVLAIASALLLGSVTAAVLNLLVTGLGVALIMGAHGRFDEALTIVSSSTPVMMVALGGAFGVHILAGYQRQQGTSRERASATLRELWKPVLLSGTTTAVAFYALFVMPQVPMQRFGIVAGSAMILLLIMALLVLPAMLSVLPSGLLKHKPERTLPMKGRVPIWLLAVIAAISLFFARGMKADPDTSNVFDEDSEVRVANDFFNENFGGSTFLQVTIDGDIGEAEVLRTIRDISEEVMLLDGVVDVRSVVEPVQVLNAALGGRRGVPENSGRASRDLTYLIGHPAMKQLMTEAEPGTTVGEGDAAKELLADGALIHIKLAPLDGAAQVALTAKVREVVGRHKPADDALRVAPTRAAAVAVVRDGEVEQRLGRLVGEPVDVEALRSGKVPPSAALKAKIIELRDGLDHPEEGIFMIEVPDAEMDALTPELLMDTRGAELEALMRDKLPSVVSGDPEGLPGAAKHLGAWIDEQKGNYKIEGWCAQLGLESRCDTLRPAFAELEDEAWVIPAQLELPAGVEARSVPLVIRLTGQPVIGQAFAESVTTSLWQSTAVSVAALTLVLLISRSVFALLPAIWTLAFSAGIIAALGHSISVGTSMVACIALGAGVDFAIHLGYRARTYEGKGRGERAVRELGAVIIVSAVQLAVAFLVLTFSEMPPLQEFGSGLAIGLIGAALGAVWFTPALLGREDKGAKSSKSSGGKPSEAAVSGAEVSGVESKSAEDPSESEPDN